MELRVENYGVNKCAKVYIDDKYIGNFENALDLVLIWSLKTDPEEGRRNLESMNFHDVFDVIYSFARKAVYYSIQVSKNLGVKKGIFYEVMSEKGFIDKGDYYDQSNEFELE